MKVVVDEQSVRIREHEQKEKILHNLILNFGNKKWVLLYGSGSPLTEAEKGYKSDGYTTVREICKRKPHESLQYLTDPGFETSVGKYIATVFMRLRYMQPTDIIIRVTMEAFFDRILLLGQMLERNDCKVMMVKAFQ